MSGLNDDDDKPRDNNSTDSREFRNDKETVKPCARLRADGVRHADDDEDEDREELVLNSVGLVGDTGGRVDALHEDNAEYGQRRRHHGDDPGPSCQEAKHIAEDVLQIRLHSAWESRQSRDLGKSGENR